MEINNQKMDVCRICLQSSCSTFDLHRCYYEQDSKLNLYEMFVQCIGIKLGNYENSMVCHICKSLLVSAYELRVKAKQSTAFLRNVNVTSENAVKCEGGSVKAETGWKSDDCHDNHSVDSYNDCEVKVVIKESDELYQVLDHEIKVEPQESNWTQRHKNDKKTKKRKKLKKNQNIQGLSTSKHKSKTHWDYRCRYCLQLFETLPLKFKCERKHLDNNDGMECHFCGKKMKERGQLAGHIFIHMFDPNRFKCQHCDKTFTAQSSLWKHTIDLHPVDPAKKRSFICSECGKEFVHKNNFLGHMARHMGESGRKKVCDLCSKRFITLHEIRKHIETVHLCLRKYVCDLCGKSFKRNLNLRIHKESAHSGGPTFECKICGKMLKSSQSLYSHQIVHKSDYKYACTFPGCQATFKHKTAVKSHRRVHEPNVTLSCPHCPKQFRFEGTLRSHIKRHSGQLYYCNMCERGYAGKPELKEHQEVVHGGKRYPCTACGCSLTSKNNLRRHIKLHCTAGVKKRI